MPRLKALPILALVQAMGALRDEWSRLPPKDRTRLAEILRTGRATRTLSARDRDDLRRIAGLIDKANLARTAMSLRGGGVRGRGLRRR